MVPMVDKLRMRENGIDGCKYMSHRLFGHFGLQGLTGRANEQPIINCLLWQDILKRNNKGGAITSCIIHRIG
jgi:hypothetical protein